ncbi:unnamed protein product [Trypanosoma congolense IL3000]|nr:unnamed protein product [Trypanosoma congolense IL3000]
MSQMVQPFVQPAPSVLPSTTASVQRVKASSPLVGGATVAPTGYVQLLAPVQNIDGSTSYQLVMMPANQLAQAAGTPAQVAQNPGAAAKVSQQLQPQQQQAIQYVWKAPNAKIQPQQMVRSPQLVAPQYASIAGQTQGFALVSPAGQQQCVMAVNANQVYQLQQTYPRQQMQPQPSPGRPVIFTGQHPQQQVLATPVMQSTTSLMPF